MRWHGIPQGVRPSLLPRQANRRAQEADPQKPAEERDQEVHGGVGARVRVDDDRRLRNLDAFPAIELTDRSGKTIRHHRRGWGRDREGIILSPHEVRLRLQEIDDRLAATPCRWCERHIGFAVSRRFRSFLGQHQRQIRLGGCGHDHVTRCRRLAGVQVDRLELEVLLGLAVGDPSNRRGSADRQRAQSRQQRGRRAEPAPATRRARLRWLAKKPPGECDRNRQHQYHGGQRRLFFVFAERVELPFSEDPVEPRIAVPGIAAVDECQDVEDSIGVADETLHDTRSLTCGPAPGQPTRRRSDPGWTGPYRSEENGPNSELQAWLLAESPSIALAQLPSWYLRAAPAACMLP